MGAMGGVRGDRIPGTRIPRTLMWKTGWGTPGVGQAVSQRVTTFGAWEGAPIRLLRGQDLGLHRVGAPPDCRGARPRNATASSGLHVPETEWSQPVAPQTTWVQSSDPASPGSRGRDGALKK